jgi:hypothetical protein
MHVFAIISFYCFISYLTATWAIEVTGDPRNNASDAYPPYDPDPGANNFLGTRLFGWDGCGSIWSNERNAINEAYYDFSIIAETEAIYQNIDFNSAAALEFLGPSGLLDSIAREKLQCEQ